jgi:SnoaL-like domain
MDDASEVITRMFHAVDDLDWVMVRRCCAPVLATDYTSLWGGEAGPVSIDDLVTDWGGMAPGFDTTQHLLGPFAVVGASDTSLTVGTNVRAYHHIAGVGTWLVAGRYVIGLTRRDGDWVIDGITLHARYEEGDRELVTRARTRTAAGEGRA